MESSVIGTSRLIALVGPRIIKLNFSRISLSPVNEGPMCYRFLHREFPAPKELRAYIRPGGPLVPPPNHLAFPYSPPRPSFQPYSFPPSFNFTLLLRFSRGNINRPEMKYPAYRPRPFIASNNKEFDECKRI